MNAREEMQKMLDVLAQQRDQLIVQAHLARLEAMEEWKNTEGKLAQLPAKVDQAGGTAGEAARNIEASAKHLAEEIGRGYDSCANCFECRLMPLWKTSVPGSNEPICAACPGDLAG